MEKLEKFGSKTPLGRAGMPRQEPDRDSVYTA
jgi:hypothetical protein